MICPFCGAAMEKGCIKGQHEMAWLPDDKRDALFTDAHLQEGAVLLASSSIFKGSVVDAWCCRVCEKLVVEY
ncbi:MAG: hypothetical protein GXX99_05230 [Clostridiales bacterium]|nr:hypothetical protein [Clostridiales bacterium]